LKLAASVTVNLHIVLINPDSVNLLLVTDEIK